MLTGLESIGNTSTSLGTNWQQGTSGQSSGPICIGKTKKYRPGICMPWVRYSRLNVFGFAYAFTYM